MNRSTQIRDILDQRCEAFHSSGLTDQRKQFQNILAQSVVQEMDLDSLVRFAEERLIMAYSEMNEEGFLFELESMGPEGLLEDYTGGEFYRS